MKYLLAYFFTFLTLLPTIISCTKSDNSLDLKEKYNYKKEAKLVLEKINILEENLSNIRNPIEINQETIEYYEELLDLEPGVITVEMVNEMIEEFGVYSSEGVQDLLEEYELDEFTKSTITSISNGELIIDLTLLPDFLALNESEKQLLAYANAILGEEINNGRSCAGWGGVGAIIGGIIGGLFCGPCIIIGAIIGGSIGCEGGGGKSQQ